MGGGCGSEIGGEIGGGMRLRWVSVRRGGVPSWRDIFGLFGGMMRDGR